MTMFQNTKMFAAAAALCGLTMLGASQDAMANETRTGKGSCVISQFGDSVNISVNATAVWQLNADRTIWFLKAVETTHRLTKKAKGSDTMDTYGRIRVAGLLDRGHKDYSAVSGWHRESFADRTTSNSINLTAWNGLKYVNHKGSCNMTIRF